MRHFPPGRWLVLCLLPLLASLPARAPGALSNVARPGDRVSTERLRVGGAEIRIERRSEHATLRLVDHAGRERFRVTAPSVSVEAVTDLDGRPGDEVILQEAELGAHGPVRYTVLALTPEFRVLLSYHKGHVDGGPDLPDLGIDDLDGDGRMELLTWYDGFAYWGVGTPWATSFGGSARIPVVLGLRRGRYVEVTRDMRGWLRGRIDAATAELREEIRRAGGRPLVADGLHRVIEAYALRRIADPAGAKETVQRELPPADLRTFFQARPEIDAILDRRSKRYVLRAQ